MRVDQRLPLVLYVVARVTDVPASAIRSDSRLRDVSFARSVFIHAARSTTGASYPALARYLNRNGHSAIFEAYKRILAIAEKRQVLVVGGRRVWPHDALRAACIEATNILCKNRVNT